MTRLPPSAHPDPPCLPHGPPSPLRPNPDPANPSPSSVSCLHVFSPTNEPKRTKPKSPLALQNRRFPEANPMRVFPNEPNLRNPESRTPVPNLKNFFPIA